MHPWLRGLRSRLPHPWNGRFVAGIPHRVHVADSMLPNTESTAVGSYVQAGQSGMDAMRRALEICDRDLTEMTSVLDLGCGFGRVLRFLCSHVESWKITACDLDARAVAFCAAELGAHPLVSKPDLGAVPFGTYDLVWSGSLLTHLPESASDAFIALLPKLLKPSGVAVISFHGEHSLGSLENLYSGDHADEARAIREEVGSRGVSYRAYGERSVGYDDEGDYGMAWHRWEYLEKRNLALNGDAVSAVGHLPRGWDDHHDVAIFQARAAHPASNRD